MVSASGGGGSDSDGDDDADDGWTPFFLMAVAFSIAGAAAYVCL